MYGLLQKAFSRLILRVPNSLVFVLVNDSSNEAKAPAVTKASYVPNAYVRTLPSFVVLSVVLTPLRAVK